MERRQAARLISDTFENPFDENRFRVFTRNLFNELNESKNFHLYGQYIKDAFKPHIKEYRRIGQYVDPGGKVTDVLVVRLIKETSLERARTMQRNFVAQYLKERGEKDAAVVAYYNSGLDDWRFSFVRMEYAAKQKEDGKVKVEEVLTPARRYSFLVGPNEPNHTAQQQLIPLLEEDRKDPGLSDIENAFSIESVTKEFFIQYRELFYRLKEELDKIVEKDPKIRRDFESKNVDTANFAKKLLGQIVFLYFLQKKGWFGVERDADWGTGPKNFLRMLFEKKVAAYDNFFNDMLEPLFYEALAIERTDDFYSRFNCKIPFLNGGLFDPINDYDWVHTDILLPDELFSNSVETKKGDKGTGVLDVFDRYNFTVREDEPLEKEVAVDPEMLGKVFENLLEVKDRKSKGTYYTPREIVHYMCRESLINYLDTEVNEAKVDVILKKPKQKKLLGAEGAEQLSLSTRAFSKEDIEEFVKKGEFAKEYAEAKERGTSSYRYVIPRSIRENAKLIDEKLANIKVCDPAVGSGAFLVGMMHEIVKARDVLTTYMPKENARTPYDFKRQAIQESLYGVDIDPSAVDIAKLRLWLSLVVDEEDFKTIKPLPNLDYKIVCGNSLLGVEKDVFNQHLFSKLEELKAQYFEETNQRKKKGFKEKIDVLIKEITHNDENFDFEIYFSEVFHKKGGFDVVIANPPYVEHKKLKGISSSLKEQYQTHSGTTDLYVYFYEKGLDVLKRQGILTFISSNKFMKTSYGAKLRDLLSKYRIHQIIDFTDIHVFDALVASCIIVVSKDSPDDDVIVAFADDSLTDSGDVKNYIENRHIHIDQRTLDDSIWQLEDQTTLNIKKKIETDAIKLRDLSGVSIFRGITTGFNHAFVIDEAKAKELLGPHGANDEIIKPLLQGRNIRRWSYKENKLYIIFTRRGINIKNYPSIKRHLAQYRDELEPGKGRKPGAYQWYEIQDNTAYYPEFEKEKIIWGLTADKWAFSYDSKKYYLPSNGYILTSETISLKYILALLNSRLMEFYFSFIGIMTAGGAYTLKRETLWEFPIKNISLLQQKPFVELVEKILNVTKADGYLADSTKQAKVREYEKQIDQLVYELYGLTPKEIEIIEQGSK